MNAIALFHSPLFSILARWLLAVVFMSAALGKLGNRTAFTKTVFDYQLLPKRGVHFVASSLPLIELAIGLLLISGIAVKLAALASSILLLGFMLAIGTNLLRGRRNVSCGCSGARSRKIGRKLLIRNAVLVALAFQIVVSGQNSAFSLTLVSNASAYLLQHVILVGWGLPLVLVVSGLLMLSLLIRQVLKFVHQEGGL